VAKFLMSRLVRLMIKILVCIVLVSALASCSHLVGDSELRYAIGDYRRIELFILTIPFCIYILCHRCRNYLVRYGNEVILLATLYLVICAVIYHFLHVNTEVDFGSVYAVHVLNVLSFMLFCAFIAHIGSKKSIESLRLDEGCAFLISLTVSAVMATMYNEGARICRELNRPVSKSEIANEYVKSVVSNRFNLSSELRYNTYMSALFSEFKLNYDAGDYLGAIAEFPFESTNWSVVKTPGYLDLMSKVYSGHSFEMRGVYWPIAGVENRTAKKRIFIDKCAKIVVAQY